MVEPGESPIATFSCIRLLVVADEANWVAVKLQRYGRDEFEIVHAPQLDEALATADNDSFSVVLVDLAASNRGLEALALTEVATAPVPIIALAERDDEDQALKALRLGVQDYIVKDQATPRTLARSVRHAVERHRLLAELDEARQREHFMATHDPLTGLANRYAFNEHLDRTLAHAERQEQRLAVFFLDLDRFKYINDTLGHSVGDVLLDQVAERISSEIRKSDLVARVGGDEFIAMIQDLGQDQTSALVAQKILESLSMPYILNGREYWMTASLGISLFPGDGGDRETLVRHADAAMYQAKARGKNNYQFYSHSLNDSARRRLVLERNLRRAFERSELTVEYQPTVEMATNRITGAEALLRWTDADLGPVSPAEFIPLAEETGLIKPLGEWTLRAACRQACLWHEAGFPDLRISVNVSTQQIRRDTLRESVVRALWDTGLDPAHLELEIIESTLVDNPEEALAALQELKRLGVGVSLDDFGTGYSSLAYLKMFPVDTVKIDQSFVNDIAIDPDDAAIVAAILSIAEQLRLRVVAEGVETPEQRAFLAARGCNEMQGHLFSRSLSGEAFLELVQKEAESGDREG